MRTIIVALTLVTLATAFRISSLHKEFQEPSYGRHSERSVDASCTPLTYTCVAQGGNCSVDVSSAVYPVCLDGRCNADGVCPTVPGLDAPCTSVCTNGLACHPVTKVCVVEIQVKPPGASCTTDNQCLYSVAGAPDVTSKCLSGSCYGIPVGSPCNGTNQCNGRAYCSSGICVDLLNLGQPCTYSDETVEAATCDEGIVTRLYSLSAGSPCSINTVCGVNHYCNASYASSGVCLLATGGGNACESNADCANGGSCSCHGSNLNTTCPVPVGISDTVSSVILGLGDCINVQKCAAQDFSCVSSKCKSQYCAYRSLVINQNNADSSCFGQYARTSISQYIVPAIDCSNAAVQQVASFAVVAFVFLAVVLL